MTRPAPESSTRTGLLAAVGAYGLWGVLPVFFLLLVPAGAFEIVGWRILFSLVVCAVVITAARRWGGWSPSSAARGSSWGSASRAT
ncbi:hypothetical protein CMMCA002_13845 [Clavibacter michiganensis subsp. michiganensis]|nr:hypothetical protein CMMCA002_13845 [Clavibacter michiganensis subsp. michiganensis]